jgi:hypothetical protein
MKAGNNSKKKFMIFPEFLVSLLGRKGLSYRVKISEKGG